MFHMRPGMWAIGMALALLAGGCGQRQSDPPDESAWSDAVGGLGPGKQKKIWDLEHVTFKLETHLGKPLVAALRSGDREGAARFFSDGFAGQVPASARVETTEAASVSRRRWPAGDEQRLTVDGAGFLDWIARSTAEFGEIDGGRLRVLQIEPVEGEAPRFRLRLLLTLRGRAATVDVGPLAWRVELEATGSDQQLFEVRVDSTSLSRGERLLMEEVTESAGLARLPLPDNWGLGPDAAKNHRYQIAVADYDRDGWLDIAVGTTHGQPFLLRSIEGRRFVDLAGRVGLPGPRDSKRRAVQALVSWIDFDGDGWPDLLMGPRLYRNVEGRRFVDVTENSGLQFDRVPLGSNVADYDGDGRLDLYLLYQKGFRERPPGRVGWIGDSKSGAENRLWRNLGDGRFEDVTERTGAGGGLRQTFAAATFFFDEDRHPDLYLANDFGKNVLLRNRGDGSFEEVGGALGAGDFATSMGVASGDLDNDGVPELYVANMYSKMGRRIIAHVDDGDYPAGVYEQILGSCAGNRLYRLREDGTAFEERSEAYEINDIGWAYAPAMADMDGDGWLDLYATTGFMSFARGEPDG